LVVSDPSIDLASFIKNFRDRFRPDIDESFSQDISSMVLTEGCCVPDDKLYQYGVLSKPLGRTIKSNNILRQLKAYGLVEGTDYKRLNVEPSGKRPAYKYYLSSLGFDRCLMRSKNHPEYSAWFHYILETKVYYELFQSEVKNNKLLLEKTDLMSKCDSLLSEVTELRKNGALLNEKVDLVLENNNCLLTNNSIMTQHVKDLTQDIDDLTQDVSEVRDKLERSCIDRVPRAANPDKLETFLLIKLGDPDPEKWAYYVIRGQRKYTMTRFSVLTRRWVNASISLDIRSQPNPKNLYVRIQENMYDHIAYRGNYISPEDISDEEFVQSIIRLNDEKYNV